MSGELASRYLVGADGRPAALVQYDAPSKQWTLKVFKGGLWQPAEAKTAAIETPELLGLGRDGHSILVGDMEDGSFKLRELSPDGARLSPPIPGAGGNAVIDDPKTHGMIGTISLAGDEQRYTFFDPDDDLRWQAVEAAFPGQAVALASWSDDRQKIVVRVDSPTNGPSYDLVDLAAGTVKPLGLEYPGLTADDISPQQPVRYSAADGLALNGYLTLPRGKPAKGLPLIVFPHGGPQDADRSLGRGSLPCRPGDDRSQARLHRRRELRRLRGACRRDVGPGRLSLRGGCLRPVRPCETDRLGFVARGPSGAVGRALLDPLHGRRERP
jgi:hypothetical protein